MEEIKPKIIVSKCIEFDHCRYNGDMISSEIVKLFKNHFDFIPICPEVESGLTIPREPTRLIIEKENIKLIQTKTNMDITEKMKEITDSFLKKHETHLCGFILKYRSPSCGISNVKLYQGTSNYVQSKTMGLFASIIKEKYPHLPIEDEGRLRDFQIREHFLKKIYAFSRFHQAKSAGNTKSLIDFHSKYKYLFIAHKEKTAREMGKLIASYKKGNENEIYQQYETLLYETMKKDSRISTNTNIFLHTLGYFSKNLTSREKEHFLQLLDDYRDKKIPFSGPASIIQSWISRFQDNYLEAQTFWMPFPKDLIEITSDSGKGKKYQ